MKRLFQLLAVASFGLALGSCDKSEPTQGGRQGGSLSEPQRFELSSSLGSVGIEALSSNTDTADDDLRATLHFKGKDNVAKTTLKAENFGKDGNLKAYWGVIYGTNENAVEVCTDAVTTEPANPNALEESTVYFQGTESSTIQSKRIKMYAVSNANLPNITKGIMLLDGNAEGSMVHFTKAKGCDPNDRIEGVAKNGFQEGRHIPIMTELKPIEYMKPSSSKNGEVKFTPRGSLIGLCLMNKTGEQMIVTGIVVPKAGALDFAGSFDWSQDGKPSFTKDYGTDNEPALVFPVYENSTATDKGYTIANNNAEAPCFFVWGFQDEAKKGEPFQVQIRYKTASNTTEQTTRTFTVYAPTSKVVTTEKKFDDGYAYNVALTINKSNSKGGSTGTDWGNGGTIPVAVNPLSYVSEGYALNKAGTGFVANSYSNDGKTDYNAYTDSDVGLFTWAEAMRQFGFNIPDSDNENKIFSESEIDNFRSGGTKVIDGVSYHLPNRAEWQSIVPYFINKEISIQNHPNILDGVTIDNWESKGEDYKKYTYFQAVPVPSIEAVKLIHFWVGKVVDEVRTNTFLPLENRIVQIGDVRMTGDQYTSNFISKEEGGKVVTYAKRFIGTAFESAWRYSYVNVADNRMLYVQCLLLTPNSNFSLPSIIARKEFFEGATGGVERYFPTYGGIGTNPNDSSSVYASANTLFYHSSIPYKSNFAFLLHGNDRGTKVYEQDRKFGFAIRPFYK